MEQDNFIKCRDGKEYEIFPALIKDKNTIRHYTSKFNSEAIIVNLLAPDMQKISHAQKNGIELNFDDSFTDEPYNAMMEILYLAFGRKVEKEKIEELVDVSMIPNILNIFYAVSGYDKKKATQTNK